MPGSRRRQGRALKIQLYDGAGGYRDNYVTIDFQGWRQFTLSDPPLDTLRYDRVPHSTSITTACPGEQSTCLIDQVEAIVQRDGKERGDAAGGLRVRTRRCGLVRLTSLSLETSAAHGSSPAASASSPAGRTSSWTRYGVSNWPPACRVPARAASGTSSRRGSSGPISS